MALDKSDSMQFDSIRFGDGCTTGSGLGLSTEEEESLLTEEFDCSVVEFFMHRGKCCLFAR